MSKKPLYATFVVFEWDYSPPTEKEILHGLASALAGVALENLQFRIYKPAPPPFLTYGSVEEAEEAIREYGQNDRLYIVQQGLTLTIPPLPKT